MSEPCKSLGWANRPEDIELARHAGLDKNPLFNMSRVPYWEMDPCAVVVWLLPVLVERWPHVIVGRDFEGWLASEDFADFTDFAGYRAVHWHLAVIEALRGTEGTHE